MAGFDLTWVDVINGAFSSSVDQAVQYREAFYTVFRVLVDAGWTVEFTSNGTVANSSNNIASAADCVFGTNGSQSLAYAVLRAPTGFGNPSGAQFRLVLVANNSNADTTPQTFDIYGSFGTYSLHGTPLSNRPVAAAAEQSRTGVNLIPWSSAQTGYISTWRNDQGAVWVGVKDGAGDEFDSGFAVVAEDTALGSNNAAFYAVSTLPFGSAALGTASNWRFFTDTAAAGSTTLGMESTVWAWGSWDSGANGATNEPVLRPIDLGAQATGANGRFLGTITDILACPPGCAFNADDSTDFDAQIYRCAGDIWMPVTAASGSFL